MTCICCGTNEGLLCPVCRLGLAPVPVRRVDPPGLVVRSAFRHDATARRLVHLVKYRGLRPAAAVLAAAMAPRLPAGTRALVPVPRARLRVRRHGVDPAAELAGALRAVTGIPVAPVLGAALWWPRHAGAPRGERRLPRFVGRGRVPAGAVLVDDVVTTGATLAAAALACGGEVASAITATAALYSGGKPPDGGTTRHREPW